MLPTGSENIPIALYDEDQSVVSANSFAFTSSGYFKIIEHIEKPGEMAGLLDKGKVKAILHLGTDLARRVNSNRTALVQVIVAGTNSNTASLVQSYALQILETLNRSRLAIRLDRNPALRKVIPAGSEGIVQADIRVWYNTELLSRNFYVPGIIALVIMVATLNLTAMSVVREKEVGP
jgi:ABC-2 type transport system permease protein